MSSKIICPNCKIEIEITEVMSAQLRTSIRNELEGELNATREQLKAQQVETQNLASQLAGQQEELRRRAETIEEQVRTRLSQERQSLEGKIRQQTQETLAVELKDRDERLGELKQQLKTAQEKELAVRKKERELEEKIENADLDVERRLGDERKKVREQALKELDEQHRLKLLEKEQQVEQLRRQIEDLKRSAEQGSQQAQGEVLEVALEQLLKDLFPTDSVEPVPKGVRGADVVQRVLDESGTDCGLILWESKRTRHWSKEWLPKLRDDLRTVGASRSVIVSEQLPEHIRYFGQVDGVWVASWACVHPVAVALREGLIAVAKSRRALEGQHGKMELVYNYLVGLEFYNRVSGIVEAFMTMRHDLDTERQAFQRCWAKREKQLQRVLVGTSGLYGDLQGIIGQSLPEIKGMRLADLGTEALPEASNGKALPEGDDSDV
ncbi:MAG: DUF2130 domain-containing protein [Sedimentisphaerales bacterium]|nr:DUF2130 domain-containing protein [Sedimentisphaerales bacterium]